MSLPTPKELKRLAAACRAAGITSFKGEGIEFTLSSEAPVKAKKAKDIAAKVNHDDGKEPDTSEAGLSEEELLMWSSAPGGLAFFANGGDKQ